MSDTLIAQLEAGSLRAAKPDGQGGWIVNQEVKQAILDLFRAGKLTNLQGIYTGFVDKHTLPPRQFTVEDAVRMVPGGTSVRCGVYLAKGIVIMPPSYINIGAYIDEGTMVDSHVLVGSCAQIGKHVHLSAGVQIGGILEPIGAQPTIIEDGAFISAGVVIVEGIRIGKNAVIAPGVVLSKSIPIYDCVNERMITDQTIPEGMIVVPGSRPATQAYARAQGLMMHCALIIKKRDAGSDAALVLEEALRK